MKGKKDRIEALKMLISSKEFCSQEDILTELIREGFEVTQATLSRDMKLLKIAKASSMNGKYVYVLPNETMYKRVTRPKTAKQMLQAPGFVSIQYSNNIAVMYLGQIVEQCETKRLFSHTLHPYTQALLSAIPVPSLKNRRERILLKGELTSPINPKEGCRFAPRCIHATEACFGSTPELKDVGNGHKVACHRVAELNDLSDV